MSEFKSAGGHPNVINMIAIVPPSLNDHRMGIVYDLCPIDLEKIISKNSGNALPRQDIKCYLRQILVLHYSMVYEVFIQIILAVWYNSHLPMFQEGLRWLHKGFCFHRDLTPGNLLVTYEGV